MKTVINFLAIIVAFNFATAQDIQYVKADNGLVIREKPSRGAKNLGKLEYGTPIEITEQTNLKIDIVDDGKKIAGQWVKVRGIDAYDFFEEGYVFNGFLTEEVLQKRFKIDYEPFTVSIEGLPEKEAIKDAVNPDFDAVLMFKLEEDDKLEGKTIRIKHHQEFRTIEVFQKHQNSIAVTDDKSHSDFIDWQHYYSSWRPLKTISSNKRFKALPISKKEAKRFINVNVEELKSVVKDACGDSWAETIKDIKSVKDHPTSVALSKLFLRVVMTDLDGNKIEKIIIFEVPIDYHINKDSYAKL